MLFRGFVVVIFVMASFVAVPFDAAGSTKCADAEGEAVILNNDVPSAKTEAAARAKWAAVEQTMGVEVKAQSVVQNMALVDDAVSKQIRGVVTSSKILKEENRKDTFWVRINACVEPSKARDALSSLALNNSVAVFIPARKPRTTGGYERDEFDETSVLSEKLIGRLTESGFTVVDVAPTQAIDAAEIEKAVKNNNFLSVRSLMYKFLTNVLVIGKLDYNISTRKGQDIGYGMSMPFNNVTVRLTYRIVTKEPSGKQLILAADAMEGRGLANSLEDAAAKGMKDLSEKLTPVVVDKLSQYIKGIAKKVVVKISDISDLGTNFEVKDTLQNIAWVTGVEEKGLGEFTVSYPENTVYLANSIGQKGNLQIINFSTNSIAARYRKQ
ncbi:MAG: hypothetical protein EPN22_05930 [Nitrospirae bacterium]|nr:MAG: hypothetical protein EPN22_05930 [Nitrospirota bacterium]